MIEDALNMISDQQNLAQAAGTYLSDGSIDLGLTGTVPGNLVGPLIDDLGRVVNLELLVQVVQTFTSGGGATLTVNVVTADNGALTTNLTIVGTSGAIALAKLIAGYQIPVFIPGGITQEFLGLQFVIGTAAMTAGKITATTQPKGGVQTNPQV
jgi:hypothetical protein